MPSNKPVGAPLYKPHSYAYWSNFYASPLDILVANTVAARSRGGNLATPAVGASSFDIIKTVSENDKLFHQFQAVGDIRTPEQLKGINRNDLDPKVQALYDQTSAAMAKAGQTEADPNFITRVFDILSRPMYAIASAFNEQITEDQKAGGPRNTDINDMAYIPIIGSSFWKSFTHGQAMWDGFAGYKKTTWSENLDQAHPDMPDIAKGVLGFALDVAMDPTSYIGVGAIKSVSKQVVATAGKTAGEADKTAALIAKGFKGDEGLARSEKVREAITKRFEEGGITDPNYLDQLDVMDFSNPKDIARFITANIDNPERAKDMAKIGLDYKAQHKKIVSAFIESTSVVMKTWLRDQKYQELLQAAMKDGLVVNPVDLHPQLVMETLKYPALTMPEAEAIGHIRMLRQEKARLESLRSVAKTRGDDFTHLNKKIDGIDKKLSELIDEVPIDMRNPEIHQAVTRMIESDPEIATLQITRNNLWKQYKTYAAQAKKEPKYAAKAERLKSQIDDVDMRISERATDHILATMNDINLPEVSRLAKYRKVKNWRTIAAQYAKVYNDERKATKAADVAAETAVDAGDLGGAVNALKAKGELGSKVSGKVNKTLENLRRELQYRINNGELTADEAAAFLKEAGVTDPSVIHDFTQLLPEDSRILHFGESYKPTLKKQLGAEPRDIDSIVTSNNKVVRDLQMQATQHAEEVSKQVMVTAIDLMEKSMTLEARRAFAVRIGFMGNGPAVASLAMPELVSKLIDTAYKANVVATSVKIYNKILVSSAGLDKGLARIRAREAGRTNELIARNGQRIQQTFQHYKPSERMEAWQQLTRTDMHAYSNPQLVTELHNELKLIADKFSSQAFPGMREPLSLDEVNMWLPGQNKLRYGKRKEPYTLKGRYFEPDEVSDSVDWLINALNESNIKNMDPVELIWDLQIATEKALARKATVESIVQNFGMSAGRYGKDGKKLTVYDPVAERLINEHGYRPHKLGNEAFIFDPETAAQLDKVKELLSSSQRMEEFGEYAGKITQAWKRIVTVYNPGFHSRNTFGDIFVSWLDGVQGVHGVQSHRMALRTIKKFRNLTDPNDPLIKAMGQPNMMESYRAAKRTGGLPESYKTVLFRKNGQDYTMGDVWAAYVNEGLLSGYTNTEFSAVFKTPGSFGASKAGQKASAANRGILHFSEAREDVFRMAHFIDVLRKSPIKDIEKASAEAGARVRKFHFDYSDFTMTEKLLFARVFPFYKWTRKAFPLMAEALFSQPGKLMLYPKAANAVGVAAGYGGTTPDIVTPEWIQARMLAPIMSGDGSTTYAGIALPYDALRAIGSPGDTALGMLHPGIKLGIEAASGQRMNGQDFNLKDALTGLFPQSNMASKQLSGSGTPEQLASFLTGITFTQNNSKTIQSELIKRKEKAYGALPPKPTSG
jgi:hypothetical protein